MPFTEHQMFQKACELVLTLGLFPSKSRLEWLGDLYYMHKRRWLYCSMKGEKMIVVAGAYRIPEWNEGYLKKMPECEEGDILFVPFVVSEGLVSVAILRLLRFCLRNQPPVRELIFIEKDSHNEIRRLPIRLPAPAKNREFGHALLASVPQFP